MKKRIIPIASALLITLPLTSCKDKVEYSNGEIMNSSFDDSMNHWTTSSLGISIDSDNFLHIINNNSEEEINQKINNLEPGYYTLKAKCKNDCNQEYCYIYGKGSNQEAQMTSIPLSYSNTWKDVIVRGIKVDKDGLLEIGIKSFGEKGDSSFDEFMLSYEGDTYKPILYGGAISWLDWEEAKGAKYYDFNKKEDDALKILKDNGMNFVRLELYNNPGSFIDSEGNYFPKDYKNPEAIFKLAKRAHDLDMAIQLSFMYSDYWENKSFPTDWKKIIDEIPNYNGKIERLSTLVYDFTYSYMKRLMDNDIFCEYVSLGNEIDPGILLPYGSSSDSEDSKKALAKLLNSGYKAVKDASPSSKVVLHLGCNANDMFWSNQNGSGRFFFDLMKEYKVNYDIIGTSFYPFWAQTTSEYAIKTKLDLNDFTEWCKLMNKTYKKDVLIMETGYNWGTPGQLSNNGAYDNIYPSTPIGQRNYMYDLVNTMKLLDGLCVGCLYWDPVLVRQEGIGYALYDNDKARMNVVETTTFFDYDHNALPVMNAYKYN